MAGRRSGSRRLALLAAMAAFLFCCGWLCHEKQDFVWLAPQRHLVFGFSPGDIKADAELDKVIRPGATPRQIIAYANSHGVRWISASTGDSWNSNEAILQHYRSFAVGHAGSKLWLWLRRMQGPPDQRLFSFQMPEWVEGFSAIGVRDPPRMITGDELDSPLRPGDVLELVAVE